MSEVGDLIDINYVGNGTGVLDPTTKKPIFYQEMNAGGGGGSATYPALITGKSGAFYTAAKYENGLGNVSTGTVTLEVVGLNMADTLPNGTPVVVGVSAIAVTGGG